MSTFISDFFNDESLLAAVRAGLAYPLKKRPLRASRLANFYAVEVLEPLLEGVEMVGKEFQRLVGKCERGLTRWESGEVVDRMKRLLGKGASGDPFPLAPRAGRGAGVRGSFTFPLTRRFVSPSARRQDEGSLKNTFSPWHYYAALRTRRPRVLVVSSNKLEQNTLRLMLEPQGYRVDIIQNREDLYAFFACHKRVDAVVVSDQFQEAGFGFFLTYFRATPASGIKPTRMPRLVYLGGDAHVPAEAMQFDAKLLHPFFTEEVLEAVRGCE